MGERERRNIGVSLVVRSPLPEPAKAAKVAKTPRVRRDENWGRASHSFERLTSN
jgi:hypothetical protein